MSGATVSGMTAPQTAPKKMTGEQKAWIWGAVILALVIIGAIAGPPTDERTEKCEKLWKANESTAHSSFYSDGGHAHYIRTCLDADDFVRKAHEIEKEYPNP